MVDRAGRSPIMADRTGDLQDGALYEEIVRRIVEVADPDRIILFGSRARGEAQTTSDIDILVIGESDEPRFERSVRLYGAMSGLRRSVDLDLVAYTPHEAWEWSGAKRALVTIALREGKVLYEKPCMKSDNDVADQWMQRAESDLATARLSLEHGVGLDGACFHAQQAAEKYLKAWLINHDVDFPFIHQLERLIDICSQHNPSFQDIRDEGEALTPYAVYLRYQSDFWPDRDEAQRALHLALTIKEFVLERLS